MAEEDVTLKLRAQGARAAARDVDRVAASADKLDKKTAAAGRSAKKAHGSFRLLSTGIKPVVSLGASAGLVMGAAGVAGAMKFAVGAASDLNETMNLTNVIFGKSAGTVRRWSKTSAQSMGLSRNEALQAAGNFGGFFKVAGKGQKDAAKLSTKMVALAGDMASFSNTTPEDALEALRSGLSGEVEPLRRYRVFLSDAALTQEASRQGMKKSGKTFSDQQKIMLRMGIIMRQTKDAQGDFGRTSDGLANQQRILKAEVTDLAAQTGQALLPTIIKVTHGLVGFVQGIRTGTGAGGQFRNGVMSVIAAVKTMFLWVKKNWQEIKMWAQVILAFTVALKILMFIRTAVTWFKAFRAATMAARVGMLGLNTALFANPIGLIILAIAALVAGLVVAYHKVDWFHKFVDKAFDAITKVALGIPGALKSAFGAVKDWIMGAINDVIDMINAVIRVWNAIPDIVKPGGDIGEIGHVGGGGAPAAAAGAFGGVAPGAGARMARGGVVQRSGVYRVGERGTEDVTLPAGAIVTPHGGGDVVVPVTLVMPNGDVLARHVARAANKRKSTR